MNGITSQVNNACWSIYVPQASTAQTIHFHAEPEECNQLKKEGHDLDGGLGPFYDAVSMEEEIDDYTEETVEPTAPVTLPHVPRENVATVTERAHAD